MNEDDFVQSTEHVLYQFKEMMATMRDYENIILKLEAENKELKSKIDKSLTLVQSALVEHCTNHPVEHRQIRDQFEAKRKELEKTL